MRISHIIPLALTLFVTSVTAVQLSLAVAIAAMEPLETQTNACATRIGNIRPGDAINYDDVVFTCIHQLKENLIMAIAGIGEMCASDEALSEGDTTQIINMQRRLITSLTSFFRELVRARQRLPVFIRNNQLVAVGRNKAYKKACETMLVSMGDDYQGSAKFVSFCNRLSYWVPFDHQDTVTGNCDGINAALNEAIREYAS